MEKIYLECFPTNETAKRMLRRVSPIYEKSYVGKWLYQVMGLEMEESRRLFDELLLQAFPETATWGLVYWEQRYGFPTDMNQGMEGRRQKVLLRRSIRAPMNPARVESIVEGRTGLPTTVIENISPYTFSVIVTGDSTGIKWTGLLRELSRIKPSHTLYELNAHMPITRFQYWQHLWFRGLSIDIYSFFNGKIKPILLNGQHTLDGSWLIDQAFKGIDFNSLEVQTAIINRELIRAPFIAFFPRFQNWQHLWFRGLNINISISNGSWLIDQAFKGIDFNSFEVQTAIINRELIRAPFITFFPRFHNWQYLWFCGLNISISIGSWLINQVFNLFEVQVAIINCEIIRAPFIAFSPGPLQNVCLNHLYAIRIDMKFRNEVLAQNVSVQFGLRVKKQEYAISGSVIMDSMYTLDGTVLMDGTRKLNANIIKEDI